MAEVGFVGSGTAVDVDTVGVELEASSVGGVGAGEMLGEGRELRFIFVRLCADQRPCMERLSEFEPCLHFHKTPVRQKQIYALNIPSSVAERPQPENYLHCPVIWL